MALYNRITYGELKNGDQVSVEGYLFEVTNIRRKTDPKDGVEFVRFEGRVIDPKAPIRGTSYDGGTYGRRVDCSCFVVACDNCHATKPAGQSCQCFDNNCQ